MKLSLLAAAASLLSLPGATLYEVSGSGQSTQIGSPNVGLVRSWTQTNTWTSVNIEVPVNAASAASVDVYLLNQIGPGTTAANILAELALNPPASGYATLFTGLTLGPGTYYLVLAGSGVGAPSFWLGASAPAVVTGPGVTPLAMQCGNCGAVGFASFLPASVFSASNAQPLVRITGTPAGGGSPVPEPSSAMLMLGGLLAAITAARTVRPLSQSGSITSDPSRSKNAPRLPS